MWETSKRPAAVRTAMCSLMSPAYSTGMSQPPNGTIFAPLSRCAAFKGVFRSTGIPRYHTPSSSWGALCRTPQTPRARRK